MANLATAWQRQSDGAAFFLSWPWIGNWLAALPAARDMGLLVADGQPAAVLGQSVQRRHRVVRVRRWHLNETGDAVLDSIALEYNRLIGAPDQQSGFAWLLRHLPAADELVVRNAEPETAAALRAAAADAGWGVRTLAHAPAARVALARVRAEGGDFVAGLGRNTRPAVRRAKRLYEAEWGPLRLDRAGSRAEALAWFEALERLHRAQWQARGQPHAFDNPLFRPFHERLIGEGQAAGFADLLRIQAGERTVGYLYNFHWRGWAMAYQSGFAPAPDNRWKPGLVCHSLAVEHYLAAGSRLYDFLAGESQYKESLANERIALESLAAFAPRTSLRAEQWLREKRGGWRDWLDKRRNR